MPAFTLHRASLEKRVSAGFSAISSLYLLEGLRLLILINSVDTTRSPAWVLAGFVFYFFAGASSTITANHHKIR